MHLPIEKVSQWMHGFREKLKMAEGDIGQLLGNCALELAEIAWECCHHPYTIPHVTIF